VIDLLQSGQQPIGGEPQKGQLRKPRAAACAAVDQQQRDAHQPADGDDFQDVAWALSDRLGVGRDACQSPRGARKAAAEQALLPEQGDFLDGAEALVDDACALGNVAALQHAIRQEPPAGEHVDRDVASSQHDRRATGDLRVDDADRGDDQGSRDHAGAQQSGRQQDTGGGAADLPGDVGQQGCTVGTTVEEVVAAQILIEQQRTEVAADGMREAIHCQRPQQIDRIGEQRQRQEADPQGDAEEALAAEAEPLIEPRQRSAMVDQLRVAQYRKERYGGGNAD
jgi:hypothetical protein